MTESLAPGEETPVATIEVVQCGPGMRRLDFIDDCWWQDLEAGKYDLYTRPTPAAAAGVPTDLPWSQKPLTERSASLADELDSESGRLTRAGSRLDGLLNDAANTIREWLAASPVAPVGVPQQQPDSLHSALSTSSVASPAPRSSPRAADRS